MAATRGHVRAGTERSVPSAVHLSFAEQVCLSLIVHGVSHGWALGTELAPGGDIGRVWTLSRPLTYRAIDGLVDKDLVARRGQTPGQGPDRLVLGPTSRGRRVARHWLDAPIRHLRDVRTELLVKVLLRRRAGLDTDAFLAAQRDQFEATIDALTSSSADDDLVAVWRRESARAVRRFLDQALQRADRHPAAEPELRLSARNQLRAQVAAVQQGEVMATIKATLGDGQPLTAAITRDAVRDLDLAPGDKVLMVIKSTEVMVANAP
jgi:molybdopterin-binding protein